jgi:GAF domain-containing protein
MKKIPGTSNISIHAQAGQKLTWGEGADGTGFAISSSTISECLRTRAAVSREQAESGDANTSMVMHNISSSAAVPIIISDEVVGVLYLDRRGGVRPFSDSEKEALTRLAGVFAEFPETTLGIS